MRISRFNQKIDSYNSNRVDIKPAKSYSHAILPHLALNEIPQITFSGNFIGNHLEKIKLAELFKNIKGEVYKIKLFNKNTEKRVDSFLSYERLNDSSGLATIEGKKLTVYDNCARKLGSVNIIFDAWKTYDYTEFLDGLPMPYLRLHMLKSLDREKYGGIGSLLLQACVEKSLKSESKGRVFLHAENFENFKNDPFIFYDKMKLSLVNPMGGFPTAYKYIREAAEVLQISVKEIHTLMAKPNGLNYYDYAIHPDTKIRGIYEAVAHQKSCRLDEICLNFDEWMYLHDDAVQNFWLQKIEEGPIFTKNNRVK